jgi:hypothetical protein
MNNHLYFEYSSDYKYNTIVVKEWDDTDNVRQFDALMQEIRLCVIACGYSEQLVNEYIQAM